VIVDTHVHVVAADRERYPLRPTGISLDWFREAPVTVEDFLELMTAAGVDRAVLVQPMSAYGFDNRYVIDAARMHSERLASVVILDTADDPARRLRAMASEGVSGVRLFAIGNPTLSRLDEPSALGLWEVAAELDLPVVVTILSDQLPELRAMLERFPEVTVALDHCGFPDLSGGPPYAQAADLFELATLPNISLKASCYLLDRPRPRATHATSSTASRQHSVPTACSGAPTTRKLTIVRMPRSWTWGAPPARGCRLRTSAAFSARTRCACGRCSAVARDRRRRLRRFRRAPPRRARLRRARR